MIRKPRKSAKPAAKKKRKAKPATIAYNDGAEGMIAFTEDNVCVPIYSVGSDIAVWTLIGDLPNTPNPKTGKSYQYIWEQQKEILREALVMENKRFKYRMLVFCWQRGEGKSLLACLIQVWKFFIWERQQIMLGANSRDQVKFVHFDIMRDIIRNSPNLYALVGPRNIQEKEIRLKNPRGEVISLVRSISSFSGIVSNITGYTFSEIFDMKNPKFFVQLDGSIRNIPNALGVIDSTVSEKTHVLYKLYSGALKGEMKTVFFSYRHSKNGDLADYWNPNMDAEQLNDYRLKFPFGEFERYFLNLWSAGITEVFTPDMVDEMGFVGADKLLLNHKDVHEILERKYHLLEVMSDTKGKGFQDGTEESAEKITNLVSRLKPVEDIYTLVSPFGRSQMATMENLNTMTDMFDTHWAICAGMDFGDPYATRGLARTIMTVVAKGLPGSRSNPHLNIITEDAAPKYLYFLMRIALLEDHSLDTMKEMFEEVGEEFDGIDTLCSERYGAWDVAKWCEDRAIVFEPIFPTYDRQREAFREVLLAMREGRFKAPRIAIPGSKKEDVLREEFSVFNHDSEKRWFGSTEKMEKYGIQDDSIFSLAWSIYGGRDLSPDDFRIRKSVVSFGEVYMDNSVVGNYM